MKEELKVIVKNSIITSLIVFVYGILVNSKEVYLGMFGGSLISIGCFYMMYLEAEVIVRSRNGFKLAFGGYLKRYLIYGAYLWILMNFFGRPMLLGGALGLLNIKFNILLSTVAMFLKKLVHKIK